MKFSLLFISLILFSNYTLANQSDLTAIRTCLQKFKSHPFNSKKPNFRVINASVKVFGIGANVNDVKKTPEVELVLVKPAVSVLSKTTYKLLNPNAWYCISAKVAVLAKTTIQLSCASRLATTDGSVTVLGRSDEDKGGVTVLGSTNIERVGCN